MSTGVAARRTDPPPLPDSVQRLVVIGFMGAGKSTVGAMLAARLGWPFVDLDDEVARRAGTPVHGIIRRRGLDAFRRLESEAGREVMRRRRVVVAVGGGWPAQPGHMELLADGALSVWLRVSAATAVERVAASGVSRPLLEVAEPLATAETLLARRREHYRRGDIEIDTDERTPREVVADILREIAPRGRDREREENP